MKTTLYIPKELHVGFQERTDTFTGKLGYVIYKDHTGKLRKEASWNSWRQRKIEPLVVENTPTNGFTFNKGVKRDGYWGNGRSVIRVWDPRDFEFEISVDNLVGVLMHSDVSKRDIVEACVFAWWGTELILLPTNSIEYQESMKHTSKQSEKVPAKSLVAGHTYSIKADAETRVVYLGYFMRYTIESVYIESMERDERGRRRHYGDQLIGYKQKAKKKSHCFYNLATKQVEVKDPTKYLAFVEQQEVHPEFATMMDVYWADEEAQKVVGIELVQEPNDDSYVWKQLGDNEYLEVHIDSYGGNNYDRLKFQNFVRWDEATGTIEQSAEKVENYYRYQGKNLPAHHIGTMRRDRDDVVQFFRRLNTKITELSKELPTDYDQYAKRNEMMKTHRKLLTQQYNVGTLHYKLEDGRVSKRYIGQGIY